MTAAFELPGALRDVARDDDSIVIRPGFTALSARVRDCEASNAWWHPAALICGILEPPWDRRADIRPVLRALKSRLIAVKTIARGEQPSYAERAFARDTRIAIAPIGFTDGYPRLPSGGHALVRGTRVPILGARATEHTILDVTDVADAHVGDEAVFLGRQGAEEITGNELAAVTQVPLIELLPRIGRMARRVYCDDERPDHH